MKILFTTKLNSLWREEVDELRKEFTDVDIVAEDKDENLKQHLEDADVIVTTELTEEMIRQTKNLKIAFFPFAGMDHLHFDLLREKNIMVSNSHGNAEVVAERGFALSLALLGKVVEYHNDLKEGQWHGFTVHHGIRDSWTSIIGRKCGIIGAGRIGKHLARMLKAFECKVYGFKKRPVDKLPENFDEISLDIDEVINKSEIIYQCLPLTNDTKDIISEERLMKMKDKYLINVGRGPVINEKGLYNALKNKVLKGAGIDVWYNYPGGDVKKFPSEYDIHKLDNIVLSPHVAGFTPNAVKENVANTIKNIKSYIREGKTNSIIDLVERY